MEREAGIPSDFQRSTRMPLDAVVRLHFEGTVAYQNGFAANVSATGMFVKHPAPPPVGTPLVFEFSLGAQRKPVQGSGEVVWVRDRYLGPGQPAGIGIRFLQLDAKSRDHIAEALFDYLERSLTEDGYLDPQRLAGQIGAEPDAIASLEEALPAPAPPAPAEPGEAPPPAGRSLGPLPSAPVAPVQAAERQPFTVFSPLDNADPRTAAIVRQALREEPASAPMRAAASAAAPRRSASTALWLVLAAAILGAGGWFAWQRWGARTGPAAPEAAETAPEPPAKPQPEPLSAEPQPGTLAESVGVDPNVPSPAANPPVAGAPAETPAETPAESESAPEASDVAAAPGAAAAPVPVTTDAEPATSPPAELARRATRVTELAWIEAGGGVELQITADGGFPAGSFSYSEIGGDKPRVLVRLRGMQSAYRGASPGGAPGVRGVRTGFHTGERGQEIHVVVDLASPPPRVAALSPTGDGLALRLAPPSP